MTDSVKRPLPARLLLSIYGKSLIYPSIIATISIHALFYISYLLEGAAGFDSLTLSERILEMIGSFIWLLIVLTVLLGLPSMLFLGGGTVLFRVTKTGRNVLKSSVIFTIVFTLLRLLSGQFDAIWRESSMAGMTDLGLEVLGFFALTLVTSYFVFPRSYPS